MIMNIFGSYYGYSSSTHACAEYVVLNWRRRVVDKSLKNSHVRVRCLVSKRKFALKINKDVIFIFNFCNMFFVIDIYTGRCLCIKFWCWRCPSLSAWVSFNNIGNLCVSRMLCETALRCAVLNTWTSCLFKDCI